MADKKISQLTNLTGANLADNDEFAVVDTSATETKAITFGELKTALDTSTGFVRITGDTMTGALTTPDITATTADINGGTIDGTTIGGTTPAAGTFTDVVSSTGDLNVDTLDLNAIAETKAVTAVDVFVYDTSKDSDGGAWRKRTQHTSWYNETLNTSTRGSRREFPAVAVIVAEADTLTIYDGDDPSLPMWMVFNSSGTSYFIRNGITSLAMLNGLLSIGDGGTNGVLSTANFLSERMEVNFAGFVDVRVWSNIANRNTANDYYSDSSLPDIVNRYVNDVAMTVLPNAPIDPATGLPVPTIAVATDGGVSVIKDDGTVVSAGGSGARFAGVNKEYLIRQRDADAEPIEIYKLPEATKIADFRRRDGSSDRPQLFGSNTDGSIAMLNQPTSYAVGWLRGLDFLQHDVTTKANSMVAYTTSTYNTGWMNGDIKGAFLSDTDDTDLVGSGELVTNGTFDTDTTGWAAGDAQSTLTHETNKLRVTNGDNTPAYATQSLGITVGKTYVISLEVVSISGSGEARVLIGGYDSGSNLGVGTHNLTFTASSTDQLALSNGSNNASNNYVEWDNISVKLADADRSVNNNGLIVNGTVTRSPVATGADLVAYSGFSGSNYLSALSNAGWDTIGTGAFCAMGWFKNSGNTATERLIDISNAGGTVRFFVSMLADGKIRGMDDGATAAVNIDTTLSYDNAVWNHVVFFRASSTDRSLYINGELISSNTTDAGSLTDTGNLPLGIGAFSDGTAPATNMDLALWRISATAPTADQIRKIYEDEKVLFQENAQATLYGSSDAVTSLAHDPVTDLLHVGTSAGRSVFQGLRRVDNTTTAVGTAISASNSLVVEE